MMLSLPNDGGTGYAAARDWIGLAWIGILFLAALILAATMWTTGGPRLPPQRP